MRQRTTPARQRAAVATTVGLVALLVLCGCSTPAPPRPLAEAAPVAAPCPGEVPATVRCRRGTDSAGAPYLIAVPEPWNGVLVVHAHGGPALGAARPDRADEDFRRWSIVVRAGYAWAASVYRQGGVAVRAAAEDTERVRAIFVEHVAKPQRTILHGQSWGANVAAKAGEMFAAPGQRSPYDGIVLSSGVLGGGARSYDFRLDLRVVYQSLCRNHPRPDEPQYPLWQGLPDSSKLTRPELAARADECLGTATPPAQRSAEQARRLRMLVAVVGIEERSVVDHLNWATWHFQDIADKRAFGNVFDNQRVRYRGSDDDAALNAGVLRYAADPAAAARFEADAGLTGRIGVPVLTVHATGDPTAFVELESAFRETMQRAGRGDALMQTFTSDREHSYLADPVYPTLFEALLQWSAGGAKPTPAGISAACKGFEGRFGAGCRFLPDYQPQPLAARSPPR